MPEATFDPIAELYDRFADLSHARYQEWLAGVLLASGGRAVDLGCGAGRFLGLLAERYEDVLAVDAAPRMIELARERHAELAIRYRVDDLWEVTPDRDGTFDLVFSVNTLHHLGPDPRRYLPHVRRLVRPGGRLVVVDCVRHTPGWASNAVAYRAYRASRTVAGAVRAGISGRSPADAMASYRLRRHPRGRSLAAAAPALTRAEFHREYAAAFPSGFLHGHTGRVGVRGDRAGDGGGRAAGELAGVVMTGSANATTCACQTLRCRSRSTRPAGWPATAGSVAGGLRAERRSPARRGVRARGSLAGP